MGNSLHADSKEQLRRAQQLLEGSDRAAPEPAKAVALLEGEAKKGRRAQRAQRPKTFFIFYRRMFHVRISVLCLFVRYHCTTRGAIRQYARARF